MARTPCSRIPSGPVSGRGHSRKGLLHRRCVRAAPWTACAGTGDRRPSSSTDLAEQFHLSHADGISCSDRSLVYVETDVRRAIVSHAGLRAGNRRVWTKATPCGSGSQANPRLIPHGGPATDLEAYCLNRFAVVRISAQHHELIVGLLRSDGKHEAKLEEQMAAKPRTSQKLLAEMREQWRLLSLYERFEQVVVVALSLIIAVVIAIALVQLTLGVLPHVLSGTVSPLDHEVFQNLFGMVMTLLIALEFKHSIIRVALRRESIVQVKTVILISLIALSRKFVILDTKATDAATIAALSGATLVLGVVYWLLRERDDRVAGLDRGELGSE